ncbi:hypothetical protein MMC09_006084 [Bachmanniomyces sp. S44760]|nr:hypothetical protein [Bachmanniomyces sp. S44760]
MHSNIYSVCHALQSAMGIQAPKPASSPQRLNKQTFKASQAKSHLGASLPSPRSQLSTRRTQEHAGPLQENTHGSNKRKRAIQVSEPFVLLSEEGVEDSTMDDQENTLPRDLLRTPKQRRRAPPCMPLGLKAKDFDMLDHTRLPSTPPPLGETRHW